MTSETETALDRALAALKIFHDIAAVDIGESEADEDHYRNSSRTYALSGPVTVGDVRKAALAYEGLAALSRAPGAEKPCWRCNGEGCIQEGSPEAWNYTDCPECGGKPFRPPPSTGGEGEAVAWRCLNVHGDAFLTEHANGAYFWAKSGKPVQPLYPHPSPEMGDISREIEAVEQFADVLQAWADGCVEARQWGGPTMYPEHPVSEQRARTEARALKALLARLDGRL